jgi:ribosome-binding factor A
MDSKKIAQINELIKRELGTILNRELEVPEGFLITILEVKVTADLREAKVWISIFPFAQAENIFKDLVRKIGYFRHLLGKRLKRFKPLPQINLILDQTEKRVDDLQQIFEEIKD